MLHFLPMLKNPPKLTAEQIQGYEARPLPPSAACPDCGKVCEIINGAACCNGIKNGDVTHHYRLFFEVKPPYAEWLKLSSGPHGAERDWR